MSSPGRVEWFRVAPFLLLHAACCLVFIVGWSWTAIAVAIFIYFASVFGLTAFYHRFPSSARQGFRWWEIDVSYYLLVIMSWLGLVWDLRPVPSQVLDVGRRELSIRSN